MERGGKLDEEEEEEVGVGSRKTVTFCCYVKRMAGSNDGCFLEGGEDDEQSVIAISALCKLKHRQLANLHVQMKE